jgi:peptidoglycan lytic transglycosylase G
VFGVLAVVLVVGLGAGLWVLRQVNPGGGPGEKVAVDVDPGTSLAGVADRLETKGVITSARIFRVYLKLRGGPETVQAGEYELRTNLSMGDARAALRRGPSIKFDKLTVPEGLALEQIADRVGALPGRNRDRFLAAARSGAVRSKWQPPGHTNLEGLLFPDTYLVTDKEDDTAILRRLVGRFDQVADEVGLGAAAGLGQGGQAKLPSLGPGGQAKLPSLGPYQLIVAASLVESEAKVKEDRPLIASVISNRLQKGMKLQIDATVLYAIGHKDKVLYSDLEVDSPYNTYKIDGLPPTPISAAGKASLEAMLHPAATNYLYYVLSDKNGKHAFAATATEFEALKAEARRKGLL